MFSSIVKRHPRRLDSKHLYLHVAKDLILWLSILSLSLDGGKASLAAAGALYAFFVFRSFGMMHDCVHRAAHAQRKANDWIGEIYGVFCFLPFGAWSELHLEHHMWTGNVEKDPSMKILANFGKNGFRVPKLVSAAWIGWIPLLGFMQHLVFWKPALKKKNYVFAFGMLLYLALAGKTLGPWAFAGGLIAYLYMVEIINFPHHLGLVQYGGARRFPVYEQMQFARSCVYPKWFAHNVLLNFNLHAEHHLLPSYPWYQLDEIHGVLAAEGQLPNASAGNEWILKQRRRPVEAVFSETFPPAGREKKAA